jgi:hypothetical protein
LRLTEQFPKLQVEKRRTRRSAPGPGAARPFFRIANVCARIDSEDVTPDTGNNDAVRIWAMRIMNGRKFPVMAYMIPPTHKTTCSPGLLNIHGHAKEAGRTCAGKSPIANRHVARTSTGVN